MHAGSRRLCHLLVLSLVLGSLTQVAAAQAYVFGRAEFPSGNASAPIVVADFNGDSLLDFATSEPYGAAISIYIAIASGGFHAPVTQSTEPNFLLAGAGDFNGDGIVDLAGTSPYQGGVSVLLGIGDGSFGAQRDFGAGNRPKDLAIADVNNDGKFDLVVITWSDVVTLLGTGNGSFGSPIASPLGSYECSRVTAADLDGDGNIDVAAMCIDGGKTYVMPGKGDGAFGAPRLIATLGAGGVRAADFNGDGRADLVLGSYPPTVYFGNGDLTFQPALQLEGNDIPQEIITPDLNGDGFPDVVVRGMNGLSVMMNHGDGSFSPATPYGFYVQVFALAAGDFNGDRRQDLAVTLSTTVDVLLGAGDGTFQGRHDYLASGSMVGRFAIADFNADGLPDIAVPNANTSSEAPPGTISIFLGNTDGSFTSPVDFATGTDPEKAISADFNGDAKLDLAIINFQDGTVSILLGNGDGTFQVKVDYTVGALPNDILAADFNRDGKLDLAITHGNLLTSYGISVLRGNGNGTFQPAGEFPSPSSPFNLQLADFNRDGFLDLAALNFTGASPSIYLGKGDGTFQSHYEPQGFSGSLTVGDFNHDGNVDLAGAGLFLGRGDGTFTVSATQPGLTGTFPISADLDGDGNLDIVSGGKIALGRGDGTFIISSSPPASSVQVADVNGDYALDLVASGTAIGGAFSVYWNQPAVAIAPRSLSFVAPLSSTSDSQTVQLSNGGIAPLILSAITTEGDFSVAHNCPTTPAGLPPAASCTLTVSFTPALPGTRFGSLVFDDNSAGGTHRVPLFGNPPILVTTPETVDLGAIIVGNVGGPATVSLHNDGTAAVNVQSILLGGLDPAEFSAANDCGGTISPGSSCSVTVTFAPVVGNGARHATLTVLSDARNHVQSIPVSGIGLAPVMSLSAQSLAFGDQLVGISSVREILLTNTGQAPLHIASIEIGTGFSQTNNCPAVVAVNFTCKIQVNFSPTVVGQKAATITINDDAEGAPHLVSVSGRGVQPLADLSRSSIVFTPVQLGKSSNAVIVWVYNSGSAPLTISSTAITGDFAQTNTCTAPVAIYASCAITITFRPSGFGFRSGAVSIVDNAPGSPHIVSLTGTGADISLTLSRPLRPQRSFTLPVTLAGAVPSAELYAGSAAWSPHAFRAIIFTIFDFSRTDTARVEHSEAVEDPGASPVPRSDTAKTKRPRAPAPEDP